MIMGRRTIPKVERLYSSTAVITFFDILIPSGVSQTRAHALLEAHLGDEMAKKVEREEWDEEEDLVKKSHDG